MKKILIALPLVLIMILSMVPVMAAQSLSVDVTYYKNPQKSEAFPTETRTINIEDESILTDAAKLKAEVEKKVKAFGFPVLDAKTQPEWVVEVSATAAKPAEVTYSSVKNSYSDLTYSALRGLNGDVIFELEQGVTANDADVVQATLVVKYNKAIDAIVAGNGTASATDRTVKVAKDDVKAKADLAVDVEVASAVKTTTPAVAAEAKVTAYPKCFVDPKDPVQKWCPELCKEITVKVWNVWTNSEVTGLRRSYTVNPQKLPTFDGIYNHFKSNVLAGKGFQILQNWKGLDSTLFPAGIEKNCEIIIYVLPARQYVDVYHELYNCCEDLDGNVEYDLWKTFYEPGVSVEFITYHTKLMVDHDLAKDFADTRLQKINATDFVFVRAEFNDGVNLDGYMTGEVYDINGNLVEKIVNEWPTITLVYHRAGCDKEEQKVDNATVENNNTQAPVTASGTQLPATGAKDVTAFFLSAVALLGLGIFFAKKH